MGTFFTALACSEGREPGRAAVRNLKELNSRRPAAVLLLSFVYVALLAFMLLSPSPSAPTSSVSWASGLLAETGMPTWMTARGQVEFALNALAFVPLPILATCLVPGAPLLVWPIAGCAISVGVEAVQGVLLSDRSATFIDVAANMTGAAIGVGAIAATRWRDRPNTQRSDVGVEGGRPEC